MNLKAVADTMPDGMVPAVWSVLRTVNRITLDDSTLKSCNNLAGVIPVVEPIEFIAPTTMSPMATPVAAKVPVVEFEPPVTWSMSCNVPPGNAAVA